METTDNQPDNVPGKTKRVNQIVFIEYEIPKDDGHKITVIDSYRNVLGRIYEKYDPEKDRLEYTFCNHEGKPQFFSADLKELKAQIFKSKAILLEQAHERRIEAKGKTRGVTKELPAIFPYGSRNKAKKFAKNSEENKKLPQKGEKTIVPQGFEQSHQEWQRGQEMRELREGKEQNRDQELSR